MIQDLVKMALAILAANASGPRSGSASGRVSTTAIYAVGTGVAAIAVLGCVMAALWIFVRPRVGPAGGALVVAAAIMLLWLVLLCATRRPAPHRDPTLAAPHETLVALVSQAQQLFH